MGKKTILAGVLGGLGMFLWSTVAHMALPLGEAGVHEIPNEQALLSSMHTTLGDRSGLYLFPAVSGLSMDAYGKKLSSTPSGLLIFHPPGPMPSFPGELIVQLLLNLVEGLLAAYLLSHTRIARFGGRVGFVTLVGLLGSIVTNIEYWNWYRFPAAYEIPYMLTQITSFAVAGAIIARVMRPAARTMPSAP